MMMIEVVRDQKPAYDMNPVTYGNGLTLNISESDNSQDLDLVISVAKYFRIDKSKANAIIQNVVAAVTSWRSEAALLKISATEQDSMANAFRVADHFKK